MSKHPKTDAVVRAHCEDGPCDVDKYNSLQAHANQLEEALADANRYVTAYKDLISLMGYVQNGTSTSVIIFQDDATYTYQVKVGDPSRGGHMSWGNSMFEAINKAKLEDTKRKGDDE